jgi:hypothetical protein
MGQPMVPLDSFMCIFIHLNNKTKKNVLVSIGRCGIKSNRYKEFFQDDIMSEQFASWCKKFKWTKCVMKFNGTSILSSLTH